MTADAHAPLPSDGRPAVRRRPGRPRSAPQAEPDTNTRDEILDVAARLFAKQGYEGTTTRQIAQVVGIKQASLYYHFADKSSIVVALLDGTVSPSVSFSEWLRAVEAEPETKLYALAAYDLDVILNDPWSMHVLSRIPDVAAKEEESGRPELTTLQGRYLELARSCAEARAIDGESLSVPETDFSLVFGLVESIVAQRYWGGLETRAQYAATVPRGCLRLLGVPEAAIGVAADQAARLIADYPGAQAR
ncbi:transcriptional regulator, TetR family [Agreia bicolorata]|uniref:Transcriptional regulator, TetR family n=1 Tax=Agreia bicolorata TaxID=110935 RepID=A0A1T4Y7U9_9MICO|nr:TetR/AcrR family transcriptional regulator [Agreia bicolorata]SKA97859.1 transcriptional regulator, TetR family [Agreia bicolorata]